MLGGMAAKWRWRAKRRAAGKSTDNPNMVCGPVQVVWHKFAKYWDIEMREIPMSPGRYCMDVEQMLERVDENTIMVVPTFGVTYTGSYEPVLELSQALDKLQEDTGLDVDIHVDGASGAFLAPFYRPGHPVGLPGPARQVHQHVGAQVRARASRRGLGPVAGRRGAARRPHLPRDLPRRGHAGVPDQLLPARRPDRGPVLQLHPPGDGRLPQRAHRLLRHRPVPGGGDRQARPVRAAVRLQPPDGDPLGGLAHPGGRGPGVHALRRRRPPADAGLAGAGLPADRVRRRHLGPAHPGAPGREPGPGGAPARRHDAGHRPLRSSPGHACR